MAKRKRNKQAKQMLESLILGSNKLYWMGEKSEVFIGKSADDIIQAFNLQDEVYDPVYGAAFGTISPWHMAVEEVAEGQWQPCPLITIALHEPKWPSEPQQLTSSDYC